MRFSADWFDEAPYAAAEELATASVFRILSGNADLTEHSELGKTELFSGLVMPTYSLAHGLARDWWLLFGSRDLDYRLVQHRMGYAMPDVRFRFDGLIFSVRSEPKVYANPGVRFWPMSEPEILDRAAAEAAIGEFIDATVGRLKDRRLAGTGLQQRWEWVQASRSDAAEAAFCEAAGALRQDPYAIDAAAAELIRQSADLFDDEALLEFLGGVGRARGLETIEWIKEVDRRPSHDSRLPELRGLAEEVARDVPVRPGRRSYELGYRRARDARAKLSLTQADRLPTMRRVADILGGKSFVPARPVNGLRALRVDKRNVVHVHLRNQGETEEVRAGHNFALARAVGDAICYPEPGRFAVNELRDASRQAAGRAFAAEFLAPIREILSMADDGHDVISIAEDFGVSTHVVELQVANAERIEEACA